MEFFFFSLYPLGSGSGSIWTFFGSQIRIRIIIDADQQHWDSNPWSKISVNVQENTTVHILKIFLRFLHPGSGSLFSCGSESRRHPICGLVQIRIQDTARILSSKRDKTFWQNRRHNPMILWGWTVPLRRPRSPLPRIFWPTPAARVRARYCSLCCLLPPDYSWGRADWGRMGRRDRGTRSRGRAAGWDTTEPPA